MAPPPPLFPPNVLFTWQTTDAQGLPIVRERNWVKALKPGNPRMRLLPWC